MCQQLQDVPTEEPAVYRCPGEDYPISRTVHLGRMAQFYPGCQKCPHRNDTGSLPAGHVKRLSEARDRGSPDVLFHDEGAGGVYLNQFSGDTARDIAAAVGVALRRERPDSARNEPPVVVLGGDGRPMACDVVAAAGEGLRWAGCHVLDVGSTTAACLAFAVDHVAASGGILVGDCDGRPHTVGLKLFGKHGRPLSSPGELDAVSKLHAAGVDRPTRTYGAWQRFPAEAPYLATLVDHYHALRPLHFTLDTTCDPLVRYLRKLLEPVCCHFHIKPRPVVAPESSSITTGPQKLERPGASLRPANAPTPGSNHPAPAFGIRIDDDGEVCHVQDERGRPVPAERLLLLLAGHLAAEHPEPAVVLERGTPRPAVRRIRNAAGRAVFSDARRETMADAMRKHRALLGGGRGGRFWYDVDGLPMPDALRTLTHLLVLLSHSDRHFSQVLDREAAWG